jgi:hypothetical protein
MPGKCVEDRSVWVVSWNRCDVETQELIRKQKKVDEVPWRKAEVTRSVIMLVTPYLATRTSKLRIIDAFFKSTM